MEFNTVKLKNETQLALRVNIENIEELASSLNGTIEDGILKFQISNHIHYVLPGDWVVLFDRGRDILVFTDKMFQRLYMSV